MRNTGINVNPYIPFAGDFFDPYEIGRRLFPTRENTMSSRLRELIMSANGQDNSAMALPGEMVDMRIGQLAGSTIHVIMEEGLFHASESILTWATGGAPYAGWIEQDGCRFTEKGVCCSAVLPSPVVSSVGFIKEAIEGLTPEEYQGRNLYESLLTLEGLQSLMNESLARIEPTRIGAELARVNNQSIHLLDRLKQIELDSAGVVSRSLKRNEEIDRMLRDNYNGNTPIGATMILLLAVVGILVLCALAVCIPQFSNWIQPKRLPL